MFWGIICQQGRYIKTITAGGEFLELAGYLISLRFWLLCSNPSAGCFWGYLYLGVGLVGDHYILGVKYNA